MINDKPCKLIQHECTINWIPEVTSPRFYLRLWKNNCWYRGRPGRRRKNRPLGQEQKFNESFAKNHDDERRWEKRVRCTRLGCHGASLCPVWQDTHSSFSRQVVGPEEFVSQYQWRHGLSWLIVASSHGGQHVQGWQPGLHLRFHWTVPLRLGRLPMCCDDLASWQDSLARRAKLDALWVPGIDQVEGQARWVLEWGQALPIERKFSSLDSLRVVLLCGSHANRRPGKCQP